MTTEQMMLIWRPDPQPVARDFDTLSGMCPGCDCSAIHVPGGGAQMTTFVMCCYKILTKPRGSRFLIIIMALCSKNHNIRYGPAARIPAL